MFWNGQAHGMQPSRIFQNGNHTGTVRHYAIDPCDNNTYYFGAPVKLTGKAFANGVAGVTLAEPGDCIVGAITGYRYNGDRNRGVVCGGCAYVIVHDDPWTIFTMASNEPLDPCDINMNFDFTPQVCTNGRLSPVAIDAATAGTDSALPLKVIRAVQAPWQNTDGIYHYEVLINCHAYKTPTAGIDDLPLAEPEECPTCPESPCGCVDTDGDGVNDDVDPDPEDPNVTGIDADGDGVDAAVDTDDNDPNVTGIDVDGDGADAAVDADDNDPNVQ